MDFDLNDEQRMLQDSLGRLLADRYDFRAREGYRRDAPGYSRAVWQAGAEMGLLALPFAEADGGLGAGPADVMLVMEALGRALTLEPWLPVLAQAPVLLAGAALPEVERIIAGELMVAVSLQDDPEWLGLAAAPLRADAQGRLHGARALVEHGDSAGVFVLAAAGADGAPGLWLVAADAPGLQVAGYATQDGRRAAWLHLAGVPARPLPGGVARIAAARARSDAALCAEAVGVMARALDLTTDYLRTREQFGRAIGSFQGLQHQAADMVVALEQARSMMVYATMMCGDPDPLRRDAAVAAARVQINRSARLIGQTAVQLHGGVGMTMEFPIGHYFKRLSLIERAGDEAARLAAVGALEALP